MTTQSTMPKAPDTDDKMARRMIIAGVSVLVVVVGLGLLAPLVTASGPGEISVDGPRRPPGGAHLLGTDRNSMDVWSRLLDAIRVDLGISVIAVAVAVVLGTLIGGLVGFYGGWIDNVSMRVLDIFQAFPTFILALAVAAALGPGIVNLTVVVALVNAPAYARLVRAEARSVREQVYVEAALAAGTPKWKVLGIHVLPNSLAPVRVIAPLNCGWAMLTLAGLSFLGLGVPTLQAEWGAMIANGVDDAVAGRWWTSIPPGVALVLCVMAFSLIGEALQERADRRVS